MGVCGSTEVGVCGSTEVGVCGSTEEGICGSSEVDVCGSTEVGVCGSPEILAHVMCKPARRGVRAPLFFNPKIIVSGVPEESHDFNVPYLHFPCTFLAHYIL